MNTDKTLILTIALACAAVPVFAADAPSAAPAGAAPAVQAVGAAPAAGPASGKPAAPKSKRKKAKSAAKSAAKPGTESVAESASKPAAKPATTEQVASDAPAGETATASPAPEAAIPFIEPTAPATPQAARVRVKARAAAAAAVAAAHSDEAPAEPIAAAAASGSLAAEALPDATKPVADAVPETTQPVAEAAPAATKSSSTQPTAEAPAAAAKPAAKSTAAHDNASEHAAKASTVPEPATPAAASASVPAAGPEPMRAAECNPPFKSEVAALFDRWNASLRSGDPKKVVANYAPGALLLPTLSNHARFTVAEKEDYFAYFLKRRPEGRIDDRVIDVDCNSATDSGLYTFRFGDGTQAQGRYTFTYKRIDGEWLIASHHSSRMPEKTESATEQKSAKPVAKPVEDTKAWVRFP